MRLSQSLASWWGWPFMLLEEWQLQVPGGRGRDGREGDRGSCYSKTFVDNDWQILPKTLGEDTNFASILLEFSPFKNIHFSLFASFRKTITLKGIGRLLHKNIKEMHPLIIEWGHLSVCSWGVWIEEQKPVHPVLARDTRGCSWSLNRTQRSCFAWRWWEQHWQAGLVQLMCAEPWVQLLCVWPWFTLPWRQLPFLAHLREQDI